MLVAALQDATAGQWAEVILTVAGYLIPVVLVPHVLLSRRDHGTTLAWILLIVLVPYAGAVAYWLLGHRKIESLERRARGAAAATRTEVDGATVRSWADPDLEAISQVARRCGATPALGGHRVRLFEDNVAAFDSMLAEIGQAKKSVELEVYIFRHDRLGRRFLAALTRAARRDVEVRLLVDGVGAWSLRPRHTAALVRAGGRVLKFLPVLRPRLRPRINFRLHRKLLVVDDRVCFLGSLNVGDELLGSSPRWREIHARIEGPSAPVARETFEADWLFAGGAPRTGSHAGEGREFPGDEVVQFFASGPTERTSATARVLFAAIAQAREEVLAATPYFVPGRQLVAALEAAALRGARVRIVLPGRSDVGLTLAAARFTVPTLREAGVEVFSIPEEMLHAKVTVVDRKLAIVGSANLDRRSLDLSFELNALFLGGRTVERARAAVLGLVAEGKPFPPEPRPLAGRLLDACARILAPVL
jgi:cardiolipin synthase